MLNINYVVWNSLLVSDFQKVQPSSGRILGLQVKDVPVSSCVKSSVPSSSHCQIAVISAVLSIAISCACDNYFQMEANLPFYG